MKKLIILMTLAGMSLPAQALDAYNWYDYNFNLAPAGAAPLILPILPTTGYSAPACNPTPGPTTVQFLGTPSSKHHTQVIIPGTSGMHDGYMDSHGNFEIMPD